MPDAETNKAAEAAGEAVEQTTALIEGTKEAAAEGVAAAEAEAARSRQVAAEIAKAAMETELGKQVGALKEDVSKWQQQNQAELQAQRENLTMLQKNQADQTSILSGLMEKLKTLLPSSEHLSEKANEKPSSPQSTPPKSEPEATPNPKKEGEAVLPVRQPKKVRI